MINQPYHLLLFKFTERVLGLTQFGAQQAVNKLGRTPTLDPAINVAMSVTSPDEVPFRPQR